MSNGRKLRGSRVSSSVGRATDKLNQRLEQLIQVANEENFKLAIIYQGLDFNREPLPSEQVDADLSYFIDHYADDPVFSSL